MTTRQHTDTLETVQHYDQRTSLADALIRHMDAEKAAGITGGRSYSIRANGAGTDWTIKGNPEEGRPGYYSLQLPGHDLSMPADDFPCCTNRECHSCSGRGYNDQQVYLGRPWPTKRSICADCGGTGQDA